MLEESGRSLCRADRNGRESEERLQKEVQEKLGTWRSARCGEALIRTAHSGLSADGPPRRGPEHAAAIRSGRSWHLTCRPFQPNILLAQPRRAS